VFAVSINGGGVMMNLPKVPEEVLVDNLILLGYRGSVSHNMYIPNIDPNSVDDIDLIGVFLASPDFYIGVKDPDISKKQQEKGTVEVKKVVNGVLWDCVYYELQKFVTLLLKGNPNVMSFLWIKREHYLDIKEHGMMILQNRNTFLGKDRLYESFTGYAYDQALRMEHSQTEGYMGKKRKRLVEKYGYDISQAAHVIRILLTGTEILKTGEMKVFRTEDVDMLLDIKRGNWSLVDVKKVASGLFKEAKVEYEKSTLSEKADYERANIIVMNIVGDYLLNGGRIL